MSRRLPRNLEGNETRSAWPGPCPDWLDLDFGILRSARARMVHSSRQPPGRLQAVRGKARARLPYPLRPPTSPTKVCVCVYASV